MVKKLLPWMALLLLIPGCVAISPRGDFMLADSAFTATANMLADLRDANVIGDDEAEVIGKLVHDGDGLLDAWAVAIYAEEDASGIIEKFNAVFDALVKYRERGE